jgi:L-asparagine transporter-like permease
MDWTQVVILIIILVVSTLLIIIGVQLIFLIRDTKTTLSKLDNILGDVEFMSRNLTRSTVSISNLVDSVRGGLELAGAATKMVSALTTKKHNVQ